LDDGCVGGAAGAAVAAGGAAAGAGVAVAVLLPVLPELALSLSASDEDALVLSVVELPVLVLPLLVLSVVLLFTSHVAANPISVTTLSDVKSTCKYPVDDLYIQGKPRAALHPPVTCSFDDVLAQ
jgi:hypothetical protein